MESNHTILNFSKSDKVVLWIGFPLIGLAIGWFLPSIAHWATTLAWVPFQGPLKLIASYSGAWVGFVTMILGLIGGIAVTIFSFHESLEMKIYDDKVIFKIRDEELILKKEAISLVFMENKQIILLGEDGTEVFRHKQEMKRDQVHEAFLAHHYKWTEMDPFADDFKKWVVDYPELSSAANALLKAREVAIKDDEDEEMYQLAKELWKLGVSVKEKNKSQYFR